MKPITLALSFQVGISLNGKPVIYPRDGRSEEEGEKRRRGGRSFAFPLPAKLGGEDTT